MIAALSFMHDNISQKLVRRGHMNVSYNQEIDELIATFYAFFDNRSPNIPQLTSLLAIFATEARITRLTAARTDVWSPEAFAAPRVTMLTDGTLTDFHEWEVERRTVVFGTIASRWSTYEKHGVLQGQEYRGSGHKLISLYQRDHHWCISSILWEDR